MKAKKMIAILLTVMMIVGSIPVFSLSAFAEGENESNTPADTTEYTEVADYDALVTALTAKQNVKLTADITFPATAPETAIAELWDGAVIDGNGFGFKGVTLTRGMFTVADGAHFTIKNLDIDATLTFSDYYDDVDRFGVLGDNIANVTFNIENVKLNVTATMTNAGGIAGFFGAITPADDTTSYFTNCTVDGTITTVHNATGHYWANGFVGGTRASSGKIVFNKCTNNADIKGCRHVSGFMGETYSNVDMTDCVNAGDIYAYYAYGAGLITYASGVEAISLNRCVNEGAVYAGTQDAAGILGKAVDAAVAAENCINRGKITSQTTGKSTLGFGGIVAAIEDTSELTFTFKGCKNYGEVEISADLTVNNYYRGVGGIVGYVTLGGSKLSFTRCSNFGNITENSCGTGGILGNVVGTSANSTVNFTECLNMGALKNKRGVASMLGAHLSKNVNTVNINSCVNVADINSGAWEGYMLGFNYSPLISDYATSSELATNIKDCIYIGKITSLWSTTVDTTTVANPPVEIDEQIRTLNTYCMGYFYNDNDTIKLDEDVPQLWGTQTTYKAGNTEMDVRFIAVLRTDKLNNYESVGFTVTPIDNGESGDPVDLNCTTVFTSLLAQGSNSVIERTAGDFGGSYIFALSVTGVPTNASFIVKPYATQKVGGDKLGVSWKLTFDSVEGKFIGTPIYE